MLSSLDVLFSSTARVQILHLFMLNPDRQFYQREIERETGQPIRAVQREVKRLAEVDLLVRSTEGNRVLYCVNPQFPLLAELTALFQKASPEQSRRVGGVKMVEVEAGESVAIPPKPSTTQQPFSWMETPPQLPLPPTLRGLQVEGEWDRT
ncbi:winged helix-turn-helix domain-containing protein [Chloroflexota bacterium]